MYWLIIPLLAALWDQKTGEIPDWITVPGITITFFYGLVSDPSVIVSMILFGVLGYLLYRYGLTGGGDILLILSTIPFLPDPILSPFLVLLGGLVITSLLYGIYYNLNKPHLIIPVPFLPLFLLPLYGTLLFALVDKKRFVKEVRVEELVEEDVLAESLKGFPKKVIEKGDKERLKELGYERVKILVNLPKMGPGLFLAYLLIVFWERVSGFILLSPVQALFLLF